MTYDVQIFLTIWKYTVKAERVTELMGVEPDTVLIKSSDRKTPRYNTWIIKSNALSQRSNIGEHWTNLVYRISGKEPVIFAISSWADVVCTIWIQDIASRPVISLSSDFIRFISNSGARFEIDYA
jgi:hypothetical protein